MESLSDHRALFVVTVGIQMAHGYSSVGGSESPTGRRQALSLDLATFTQRTHWSPGMQHDRGIAIGHASPSLPSLGPVTPSRVLTGV